MSQARPERVLVLRTLQAVRDYLENYPTPPAERGDIEWLDESGWQAEGDDADRNRFDLACKLGFPIVRMQSFDRNPAQDLMTPERVRAMRAVPIALQRGLAAIAFEEADNLETMEQLNFMLRERVVPLVATPRTVRDAIAQLYDREQDMAIARQLGLDPLALQAEHDVERLAREKPVVGLVTDLIAEAVRRRASDIHIRPGERGADVLYRIDDELVPVRRFIRALLPAVVSRVKVLGDINLAEHRKPQDGRTTFTLADGRKVDLRISVMPAVFGESVVIRLLDASEGLWSLDQLGLSAKDRERFDDVMSMGHGIFLATGPTGCGKSTTLYAMLLELRKQRINILTIEDPVEFFIEDIQQMQVNRAAGFTFANAMRNFLRHDPDVIMVGEIRDRETAGIAVESALTGHLVLSTLHTNTAATTVTRLLDLGIEPYLLQPSLLAVMSQRLARLTCRECLVPEQVEPHVREMLGVGLEEKFHTGAGCPACEGLGVHRRRAVYELLVVTPALRRLMQQGADAESIHRQAVADGMTPLTEAAVALARSGQISLAEAWRMRG